MKSTIHNNTEIIEESGNMKELLTVVNPYVILLFTTILGAIGYIVKNLFTQITKLRRADDKLFKLIDELDKFYSLEIKRLEFENEKTRIEIEHMKKDLGL